MYRHGRAQGKRLDRSDEFCQEDRDGMCHVIETKASMILQFMNGLTRHV